MSGEHGSTEPKRAGSQDFDTPGRGAEQVTAEGPKVEQLSKLAGGTPLLTVESLFAGYGKREVLHDFSLQIAAGRSLCLIGPNGAGKSTVLHSIYGFTDIYSGSIQIDGGDVTRMTSSDRLKSAGIAYVLQDDSVFPDMTVEENLLMGGFLMEMPSLAKAATEQVFEQYPRLAERRHELARALSGGERRLLEISRALLMDPRVLLVDEPSIGLEPRYIGLVFDLLKELQEAHNKTIVIVEQNATEGLRFADVGYVLVAGQLAMAAPGDELLENPEVGRLFLGGRAARS